MLKYKYGDTDIHSLRLVPGSAHLLDKPAIPVLLAMRSKNEMDSVKNNSDKLCMDKVGMNNVIAQEGLP
jgi:hypothetical protein